MKPMTPKVVLPGSFPNRDYVPFGYIDNPWHSSVANRSGVIRTVPPMGFGYWCRRMPWAYGEGTKRNVNYLSFLQPAFNINGVCFHMAEDFAATGVKLVSRYHTKNLMSYDWQYAGISVSLKYFLIFEHALGCLVELHNRGKEDETISFHATHQYGWPETNWWGSNGFCSVYNPGEAASIAKIWAYGDVFAMGADRSPISYKATASESEWREWMIADYLESNEGASSITPNPVFSCLTYLIDLPAGASDSLLLVLARGVNELYTLRTLREAFEQAPPRLKQIHDEDKAFYYKAPTLAGDWPDDWKSGWVYDLETIRINVRPPVGIFKHHWDAMQIFTPRSVLGEAILNAMCLSYADRELAKEVILGTFADAPMPNVPCVREDGSVNMISMGGEECGTAPIWVLPFKMIHALYALDHDEKWLAQLYPHLEAFLCWWLENRTDENGWFFCNNSWESGQDGSKRFLIEADEEGKEAEYVRTVDVEAAMASAMMEMSAFAKIVGQEERVDYWREMAEERIRTTRAMFVDGWFRDFDARNDEPIIIPDYLDVMMLLPIAVGIATDEQIEAIKPKFQWFVDNPKHWLEWPSFMFAFTEAGWNAGLRQLIADVLWTTAQRVYGRTNCPKVNYIGQTVVNMPDQFNYRIPGIANEFWPIEPTGFTQSGSEAYGWGATLPLLIVRNILGFRESNGNYKREFLLAPTLPTALHQIGHTYIVTNLSFRECRFDLRLQVEEIGRLSVTLNPHDDDQTFEVRSLDGKVLSRGESLSVPNGTVLKVIPTSRF